MSIFWTYIYLSCFFKLIIPVLCRSLLWMCWESCIWNLRQVHQGAKRWVGVWGLEALKLDCHSFPVAKHLSFLILFLTLYRISNAYAMNDLNYTPPLPHLIGRPIYDYEVEVDVALSHIIGLHLMWLWNIILEVTCTCSVCLFINISSVDWKY